MCEVKKISEIKNLMIQKRCGCFSVTTNTISFSSVERFKECPLRTAALRSKREKAGRGQTHNDAGAIAGDEERYHSLVIG